MNPDTNQFESLKTRIQRIEKEINNLLSHLQPTIKDSIYQALSCLFEELIEEIKTTAHNQLIEEIKTTSLQQLIEEIKTLNQTQKNISQ